MGTHVLASIGEGFVLIAIAGGLGIAVLSIVLGIVRDIAMNRQREISRRELAAYVAEGTMTAADAERLMTAGGRVPNRSSCSSHGCAPINA